LNAAARLAGADFLTAGLPLAGVHQVADPRARGLGDRSLLQAEIDIHATFKRLVQTFSNKLNVFSGCYMPSRSQARQIPEGQGCPVLNFDGPW
jgi:hypothetical protein